MHWQICDFACFACATGDLFTIFTARSILQAATGDPAPQVIIVKKNQKGLVAFFMTVHYNNLAV